MQSFWRYIRIILKFTRLHVLSTDEAEMAKEKPQSGSKTIAFCSYGELASELMEKKQRSLYVMTGEEEYLIDRAVSALSRNCVAKGFEEIDSYTADYASTNLSPDQFYELVATPPFMSERRFLVFKNTGLFSAKSPDNPELTAKYVKILADIPSFVCVVMIEEKIDKRKKALLEAAAKSGLLVQVDRQSPDSLCKWIVSTLARKGIKITQDAANSMIDRTESKMRVISSEIEKVSLYALNMKRMNITLTEIEEICVPDIRGSIFQMTDAIGQRNPDRALRVLDLLISLKEPVPKIRFMLSRHIRQLICAKEIGQQDKLMSTLKVVPFVARNLTSQSKCFQMNELLKLYAACAASDYAVKTGQMEDRLSLETLLVRAGKKTK